MPRIACMLTGPAARTARQRAILGTPQAAPSDMRHGTASDMRQGTRESAGLGTCQGTASAVPNVTQGRAALAAEAAPFLGAPFSRMAVCCCRTFARALRMRFFLSAAVFVAPAALVIVGLLTAPRLPGQSPPAQSAPSAADKPAFQVASIKRNKSGGRGQGLRVDPGGRVTAYNVPARLLILSAYRLTPTQSRLISGAPNWIDSERYDLEAKAEGNFLEDQLVLMLQALLADRLKLKAHIETRQLPVYALVLAKPGKTGPQLAPHTDDANCDPDPRGGGQPVSPNSVIPRAPCGGIRFLSVGGKTGMGGSTTMETLAWNLSGELDRAVLDRTGLTGDFDLTMEYTPELVRPGPNSQTAADAPLPDPSGPPSIFTALQQQLGLKLVPQTGPVDVLVIDHVERPSEN